MGGETAWDQFRWIGWSVRLLVLVTAMIQLVVASNVPRKLLQLQPAAEAHKTVTEEFNQFMKRAVRPKYRPRESWGIAPVPDFSPVKEGDSSHHKPEYPSPPPLMINVLRDEYKIHKTMPEVKLNREESVQLQVAHAPFVMMNYGRRRLHVWDGVPGGEEEDIQADN